MSQFPYTLSDKTCTVFIDGRAYQTDRTNPQWEAIKEGLSDPDITGEQMIALLKPITSIANALIDVLDVRVENGQVWYGDEPIHTALTDRVLDVLREGLDVTAWVRFTQNVYANPFTAAREELYLFLEGANLPITPDGCFIAYKAVTRDYKDCHTRTFDNSIGATVVMPGGREAVDPDRHNTCSRGLHFCSLEYLRSFSGDRIILVKINPADVVSIPADYSNTKGRCWRYEVVGEIDRDAVYSQSWPAVATSHDEYDWDEQGDEEDEDVTPVNEPCVNTASHGVITKSELEGMLDDHNGNAAALARTLNVPAATVRDWRKKLLG